MSGPYETERQAANTVRHILDSLPGMGAWADGNRRLLEGACRAAGVQLGAYDYRILLSLAGWESATYAVIAGLITRAAWGTGGEPVSGWWRWGFGTAPREAPRQAAVRAVRGATAWLRQRPRGVTALPSS